MQNRLPKLDALWRWRTGRALALAASFLFFGPQFALGQAVSFVGLVEQVDGPSDVVVERDGRRVDTKDLLLLQIAVGDRISVGHADTVVRLRMANQEAVDVRRTNSPYIVPQTRSSNWVSAGIMRHIAEILPQIQRETPRVAPLAFRTTDGPRPEESCGPNFAQMGDRRLAAPLLEPDNVKISTHLPGFSMAWLGGRPPFRVTLEQSGSVRPALSATVRVRCIKSSPLAVAPGSYRVRIDDAEDNFVEGEIRIVAAEVVPKLSLGTGAPSGRTFDYDLAYAYWLSTIENGAWAFEAFRMLDAVSDSGAARALRDGIAAGHFRLATPLPRQ